MVSRGPCGCEEMHTHTCRSQMRPLAFEDAMRRLTAARDDVPGAEQGRTPAQVREVIAWRATLQDARQSMRRLQEMQEAYDTVLAHTASPVLAWASCARLAEQRSWQQAQSQAQRSALTPPHEYTGADAWLA